MNDNDPYMNDFMKVFETLIRWGPGSADETLKALNMLPVEPSKIIEIGSGKGLATLELAAQTNAEITAVDNEPSAIEKLAELANEHGYAHQIKPVCASMTELPFDDDSADLIWSEGSAYIMGVANALTQWRRLLTSNGLMVFSDLVWLTDEPSDDVVAFWKNEYADMTSITTRLQQIEQAGYELVDHFTLSEQAWKNYYLPLDERVNALRPSMPNSQALADIATEVELYKSQLHQFGYQMFIIKKR
ncbi:class I SAM-dependent methyltransferase [Paraferrimonas haliotis]|uniref:Methyltransferase domain-containing protein n=1 Tax=Paraferrimonas haliotis TaxID=2013866 RepID=A0AA37WX42_9GAMM|nr:class I SAM-dependent methyltransferase [Paraferrimonas haliotis]GLS83014.1 hypothetical protein GCM10007894_09910 [Paraferrimonas haliotis]